MSGKGIFDGTLIVSDIDGTFLGSGSRIVERNIKALDRYKAEGGRFTVATGREWYLVLRDVPFMEDIVNAPIICCNGAEIYDMTDGAVIRRVCHDGSAYEMTRELMSAFPELHLKVTVDDKWYYTAGSEVHGDNTAYPDRINIMPYTEFPRGGWMKILFWGDPKDIVRIKEYGIPRYPGFVFVSAHDNGVEIQSPDGTKASMLPRLKDYVGADSLWAVGDYENDILMLRAAENRACPENALDAVKSIPGIVRLCSNDDGCTADLIDLIRRDKEKG